MSDCLNHHTEGLTPIVRPAAGRGEEVRAAVEFAVFVGAVAVHVAAAAAVIILAVWLS